MRVDFLGNLVIYTSVIQGAAYQSIHRRDGMTDEKAKTAFIREHKHECEVLIRQNKQHESKSIA